MPELDTGLPAMLATFAPGMPAAVDELHVIDELRAGGHGVAGLTVLWRQGERHAEFLEGAAPAPGDLDLDQIEAWARSIPLRAFWKSQAALRLVLRLRIRTKGWHDEATLLTAQSLAESMKLGDPQGGLRLLEEINKALLRTRISGPTAIGAMSNLAFSRTLAGDNAAASDLEAQVLSRLLLELGDQHPATLTSMSNLAIMRKTMGDHNAAAELALKVLRATAQVKALSAGHFGLPSASILLRPHPSCPDAALREALSLFPTISGLLTLHLEIQPLLEWPPLVRAYQEFHIRLATLYGRVSPDRIVDALAPLHGLDAWRELQMQLEEHALADGHDVPRRYVRARQALRSHRARLAEMQAEIDRYRKSPVPTDPAQLLADAPRVQLPPSHAVRLEALLEQDNAAASELALARQALARSEPAIHALFAERSGVNLSSVHQGLGADEAFVTFIPSLDNRAPIAVVLRVGETPKCIDLPDLLEFGDAGLAYIDAVRLSDTRGLRDLHDVPAPSSQRTVSRSPLFPAFGLAPGAATIATDLPDRITSRPIARARTPLPLQALRVLGEKAFWSPILEALDGVRTVHLVTGPGEHAMLFESALPPEAHNLRIARYCGLAAYQRLRLTPDTQASRDGTASPPTAVMGDTSWDTDFPALPFTGVEVRLAIWMDGAHVVSPEQILRTGVSAKRLVLSCHGDTRGANRRHGVIVLGGHARLDGTSLGPLAGNLSELFSLSCFGGRIASTETGDPVGVIASLQLHGMHAATACLAPVHDFYAPLLAAHAWYLRSLGQTPLEALHQAKDHLLHAPWPEKLSSLLREAYRQAMLEVFGLVLHGIRNPSDRKAHRAMSEILTWPLLGAAPAMRPFVSFFQHASEATRAASLQRFAADVCARPCERDALVALCLEHVLAGPTGWRRVVEAAVNVDDARSIAAQRALQAVDHLCAITVCYGGF